MFLYKRGLEAAKITPSGVSKVSSLIATHAEGSWVWAYDEQGVENKYLDFSSGIGVTNTGHCHPKVVQAIQQQASQLLHAQQNLFLTHTSHIELLDRLLPILPENLTKVFLVNSGSEATDNVIKIARAATKRPNTIVFDGGFHGRTIAALTCTTSKTSYRQGFQPLMPGVFISPFPYKYHWSPMAACNNLQKCCTSYCLNAVKELLIKQTAPQETACMFLEPIMGEGGILEAPEEFLLGLKDICNEHGILLVMDEVQSGMGRTGSWWAHEKAAIKPDIMTFAKGLGSGVPIGGLAMTEEVSNKVGANALGGTYGANALACAAASATIDAIIEDNMIDNAIKRGRELLSGLQMLAQKFPIGDIRGRGLMMGVEFSSEAPKGTALKVIKAAQSRGLILMAAGPYESIRFLPALNVSEEEVTQGLELFKNALGDILN